MIALYKRYCDSIHYQPLSNSILWYILNDMGPSQRKCLAGVDITGAAMRETEREKERER